MYIFSDLVGANVPGIHRAQDAAPSSELADPGAQATQVIEPVFAANDPVGVRYQFRQIVIRNVREHFPVMFPLRIPFHEFWADLCHILGHLQCKL